MTPRDARTLSWLRWRRRQLGELQDVPVLGSPAFDRLPGNDPRRLASVLRAATAWWENGRPERIAERLADEFAINDEREAQAFATVAARVRRLANQATHAEIVRRWAS